MSFEPSGQSDSPLIPQQPLVDQVVEILHKRIVNGTYLPGSKMPTGDQLAKELNISRSTVRIAMSKLEDRRLVQRRQGVGTYVRESKIPNPLNEFIELFDLIREHGYEPGCTVLSQMVEPDDEIQEILHLPPGREVLEQRKVFTANGDPFIYVVNHIPFWVFKDLITREEALKPELTDEFVEFFEETCQQKISHFISTVRADIYKNIHSPIELANDGPETPVLVIRETGFNEEDKPIVNSYEFHPGRWMNFQLMRFLRNSK